MKKLSSPSGCQSPKRIAPVGNIHDYVDLRIAAALGQHRDVRRTTLQRMMHLQVAARSPDWSRLVRRSDLSSEARRRSRNPPSRHAYRRIAPVGSRLARTDGLQSAPCGELTLARAIPPGTNPLFESISSDRLARPHAEKCDRMRGIRKFGCQSPTGRW
jgi:hypothetical protein